LPSGERGRGPFLPSPLGGEGLGVRGRRAMEGKPMHANVSPGRHPGLLVVVTAAFVLGAGLSAAGGAAEPALMRFTYTEPHMGTQFKLILYAPDESTANTAAEGAFARVTALDGIMSDYRPTSELMQLCQKAGGEPVHVSDELFFVLSRAQEVSRRSGGAFDVTVGPVVKLWRQARKTKQMPDAKELAAALAL